MLNIKEIQELKQTLSPLSLPALRLKIKGDNLLRSEIERAYITLTHTPLNKGCNDCYFDAAIVILTTKTEEIIKSMERKYILKNGVVLRHNKVNGATLYTYKNLTDEIAKKLIKAFGWEEDNVKRVFAYFPSNWKAEVYEEKNQITNPQQEEKKPKGKRKK